MKWSLQDLAEKLNNASRLDKTPASTASASRTDKADATQAPGTPVPPDGKQDARVTTADTPSNQMMATAAGPLGGDPLGRGGESSQRPSAGKPLDLTGCAEAGVG